MKAADRLMCFINLWHPSDASILLGTTKVGTLPIAIRGEIGTDFHS